VSTAGDHHPGLLRNTSGIYSLREMFLIREQHTSGICGMESQRVGDLGAAYAEESNNSSVSNKSVRSTVQEAGLRLSQHPRA